jgi:hypothetical protein
MTQNQVLAFVDPDISFDLPTTAIVDAAYNRAIAALHDRGPDSVRRAVARRIVVLASSGERDPDRLCDKALVAVGFFP